jgi:HD-GYP domain-containing protein (c-di-GMP phosphodiesterase class II)
MDEVNRVVSDMTGSVLRNPDALASLSRLKKFDEYTFYHSVNTSILAMSLGRDLSFERNASIRSESERCCMTSAKPKSLQKF